MPGSYRLTLLLAATCLLAPESPAAITIYTPGFFAQIADGGGWKSTMILRNSTNSTVKYRLEFRDPFGNQLRLQLADGRNEWFVEGSLFGNGTLYLPTLGTASVVSQGWVRLSSPECSSTDNGTNCNPGINGVTGTLVFQYAAPGTPSYEVSIPLDSADSSAVTFPFSNADGYRTAFALLNPSSLVGQRVRVTFRAENGGVIAEKFVSLGPRARVALLTSDLAPETLGARGTLILRTDTGGVITTFGLLANPTGPYTSLIGNSEP